MKAYFQFIMAFTLLSFMSGPPKRPELRHSEYEISHGHTADEKGVFLMYVGNVGDILLDLQVEMVTSIGIQYSASYSRGDTKNPLSHMAIFYKFSKPEEAVYYNYLTHESKILSAEESPGDDNGPNVTVVGEETIKKYPCTHLINKSVDHTEEYWMSQKVPGFETLVKRLYKVDPNLVMLNINGTIFNWGGLVKLRWTDKDKEVGNLELTAASSDAPIPASDFDPPKK